MKEVVGYTLTLKGGEVEDRFIRGISAKGGQGIIKLLSEEEPPKFIEIKGRMVATNYISQLVPIYREV